MITRKVFDVQRRIVAHKTVEAWDNAPHVSILVELDVTTLIASTAEVSACPEYAGTRVTINSVMLKIIAEGLKKSPEMNAHVQYSRLTGVGQVWLHDKINIATPFKASCGRMITPVIKGVERMTLLEVCRGMEELKRRVANTQVDLLLLEAAHDDTWKRVRKGQLWAVFHRVWANYIGRDRVILPSREVATAYYRDPGGRSHHGGRFAQRHRTGVKHWQRDAGSARLLRTAGDHSAADRRHWARSHPEETAGNRRCGRAGGHCHPAGTAHDDLLRSSGYGF